MKRFLSAFGMTVLFYSCAQIVPPAGGTKDASPPRAMKYIPDSAAINFSAKNITIIFDEYIQLNDLQTQLTVSPPLIIPPEVKVKGKILLIELKDTLKKNTTYTLNFGSSIRDFTEGNAKADFQYIFSTGSYIDTLQLTGKVKNEFDRKTDKGILVMLYDTYHDSVPYKKLPSYFAKTNKDGVYKISNIRPGVYKIFALKDANANYIYDLPAEEIAFSDTLMNISGNTSLNLSLFKEDPEKQKLLGDFIGGYGSIFLVYAKPVQSISYKPLNNETKTETFLTGYNTNRDTITLWFPIFSNDSLHFQVFADAAAIDTIKISANQFKKESGGRGESFKLNVTTNVKKENLFDIEVPFKLFFNHPIKDTVVRNYIFKEDTTILLHENLVARLNKIYNQNQAGFILAQPTLNKGNKFPYAWKENTSYSLFIPPATFTDIFGLTNDTIKIDFKTQEEKYYGTLKMNLKMNKPHTNCIVQFLDERGNVVQKDNISGMQTLNYSYLHPGKCKMKIIYDANGDGKWTTGDYSKHQQAEKIVYYPGEITIRSNWDLELDWKIE